MNVSKLKSDCLDVRVPLWLRGWAALHGIDVQDCKKQAANIIANNVRLNEHGPEEAIGRCRDAAESLSAFRAEEHRRGRKVGFGSVWVYLLMFVIEMILRKFYAARKLANG